MPLAPEGRAVGVMLPNANGAVVTVLGLMSAGRVPAMINFTAGATNILAACKAAEIKHHRHLAHLRREGRGSTIWSRRSRARSRSSIWKTSARPSRSPTRSAACSTGTSRWSTRKADDWAAILFTSGSEGVPKGVVLSHRNMLANAAQAAARIDFGRQDKVFNVLPMFHSFGLTVGVMLPLVSRACASISIRRRCTTARWRS